MYELAQEIAVLDGILPKGTRLSSVYEWIGGCFLAIAHTADGRRIKVTLAPQDLAISQPVQ